MLRVLGYAGMPICQSGYGESARLLRRRGSTAEQFSSVGELERAPVGDRASGLGTKSLDLNFDTDRNRVRPPAQPDQRIRSAEVKSPVGDFTIGLFHVDIKPGVGIRPVHFCCRALYLHGLVDVELRRKGMVCGNGQRG